MCIREENCLPFNASFHQLSRIWMLLNIRTLKLIFQTLSYRNSVLKFNVTCGFFPFWNKNVYCPWTSLKINIIIFFYHVLDHYSVLNSFCHFWFRRIGHENFPLNDFGLINFLSLRRYMECFFWYFF